MEWTYVIIVLVVLALLWWSIKVVSQYERGVHFRLGKVVGIKEPGLNFIVPLIDNLQKVDMRVITLVVEPQEVITKDNVTMKVDAVVYFQVVNPEYAKVKVLDYVAATSQIAQTTLRSVLGQSELDEILAHREQINQRLREIIDEVVEPWGVQVSLVEVKDVQLPETMQRAMARQAEAERDKRAKVIHAQGEYLAAQTLVDAARIIAEQPAAMQLRYLQSLVEMASEHNATIIPVPIDLISAAVRVVKDLGPARS